MILPRGTYFFVAVLSCAVLAVAGYLHNTTPGGLTKVDWRLAVADVTVWLGRNGKGYGLPGVIWYFGTDAAWFVAYTVPAFLYRYGFNELFCAMFPIPLLCRR